MTMQNDLSLKIMLVKGHSPVSWIIKKATKSKYSHIGFVIGNKTFEMDFGGFYSRDIDIYRWSYELFEIKGLEIEQIEELRSWCLMHRFTPYDYGKVLNQGLAIVLHYSGLESILLSKRAMSCSEFVCAGLKFIGLCDELDCTVATPESVREMLVRKRII